MQKSRPLSAFYALQALLVFAVLIYDTEATVILKTGDYNLDQLPDLPADFGPPIARSGIEGVLVVADPEDACTKLAVPAIGGQPWIALMIRSQRVHTNCTFDAKVRHAEEAGAAAAIVYDDSYEALIIMSKPLGHKSPGIPSVFVSQKSGIIMKKLMTPGSTTAVILPLADEVWLSILMSAFSGVIAVGVMLATFYFIRRHRLHTLGTTGGLTAALLRGEDEGGMAPAELRALPVVIYEPPPRRHRQTPSGGEESVSDSGSSSSGSPRGPKGGGTLKTCAICIEDYADGDKQRVLPCKHRFHMECIDQWLAARRPLCPICKWDASHPFPDTAEAAAAAEAAVPEEHGFLTRRWRRWRWRRARHRSGLGGTAAAGAGVPIPGEQQQQGQQEADVEAPPPLPPTPHNFPGMQRGSIDAAAAFAGGEISAAPEQEPAASRSAPASTGSSRRGDAGESESAAADIETGTQAPLLPPLRLRPA